MPKAPVQQRQEATEIVSVQLDDSNPEWRRFASILSERSQKLLERDLALQAMFEDLEKSRQDAALAKKELEEFRTQLREILSSSSWRLSLLVRWTGAAIQFVSLAAKFLFLLLRQPANASQRMDKAVRAFRYLGPQTATKLVDALIRGTDCADTEFLLLDLTESARVAYQDKLELLSERPLISILLTVSGNTPRQLLESVDSVQRQVYSNWELCIACAAVGPRIPRALRRLQRSDARVKVDYSQASGHIADLSNRALAMTNGAFVVRISPGDLLLPQALLRLTESILEDSPDIVYSDEAIVSHDRTRVEGYVFRPAFSIERLRSHPYIGNLTAFRRTLAKSVGGFEPGLRHLADYDLILRVYEKSTLISHIPEVLYLHRQQEENNPEPEDLAKIDATAREIVRQHLSRMMLRAEVRSGMVTGYNVLKYDIPVSHRVAVIIPTKNHAVLARQCITSLESTITGVNHDLVLVDHASDEPDFFLFLEQLDGRVRIIKVAGGFNFSAINNLAVRQLGHNYTHYLFCNNDIQAVEPGWLDHMMGLISQVDVGVVGAKLLYQPRGMIQHAGVCVGLNQAAEHYGKFVFSELPDGRPNTGYVGALVSDHEVSAVTGACLLVKRDVFEVVGGFDESLAVGFGDVDLCLRVREKGYRIIFSGNAQLVHHESYSRGRSGSDPHPVDSALFRQRWQAIIDEGDPFYNPNLTSTQTNWEIAISPAPIAGRLHRRLIARDTLC